jgi:hypothetical protein
MAPPTEAGGHVSSLPGLGRRATYLPHPIMHVARATDNQRRSVRPNKKARPSRTAAAWDGSLNSFGHSLHPTPPRCAPIHRGYPGGPNPKSATTTEPNPNRQQQQQPQLRALPATAALQPFMVVNEATRLMHQDRATTRHTVPDCLSSSPRSLCLVDNSGSSCHSTYCT